MTAPSATISPAGWAFPIWSREVKLQTTSSKTLLQMPKVRLLIQTTTPTASAAPMTTETVPSPTIPDGWVQARCSRTSLRATPSRPTSISPQLERRPLPMARFSLLLTTWIRMEMSAGPEVVGPWELIRHPAPPSHRLRSCDLRRYRRPPRPPGRSPSTHPAALPPDRPAPCP